MEVVNLPYFINVIELITAIFAFVHYKKYIASTEKYFLHFLWFTFFVDFSGGILGDVFEISNMWIYNMYTGISFLFYFKWYHSILLREFYKKTTLLFSILFVIVLITNFIINTQEDYHSNTFVTGAIFVLILTGFHLYQLANTNYVTSIKYKLSFWISIALVLFNIGMIPLIILSKYFNIWGDNLTYLIILLCLNTILYSCYIIGFTWTKTKYNHF